MKRLNEFKRRKGAEQDPEDFDSDDAGGGGARNGGGGGGGAGDTANKSDEMQAGELGRGEVAFAAGGATAEVGDGQDPQVRAFSMPGLRRGVCSDEPVEWLCKMCLLFLSASSPN